MDNIKAMRQESTECNTIIPLSPTTVDDNKHLKVPEEGSVVNSCWYLKLLGTCSQSLASTFEWVKDQLRGESFYNNSLDGINFSWLSNKCSNLGRIDSISDYEDLYYGKVAEDQCAVLLTLNTLQEINEKFRGLFKNEKGVTSSYFANSDQTTSTEEEFDQNEIKKIIMLSSMNACMEQNNKLLLLIYLLKVSIEQRDSEDFSVVVETLYYLSQLRRFNDAFLTALEEITLFSASTADADEIQTSELEELIILSSEFYEVDVSPQAKIYYLGFLWNLAWKARSSYSKIFAEKSQDICKHLVVLINWRDLFHHAMR